MTHEYPLSLAEVARHFMVDQSTVIDWSLQRFLPRPDWIQGDPYWWPACLETHHMIVWRDNGAPSPGKCRLFEINYFANKRGLFPFGEGKKRGRPPKNSVPGW